MVSPEHQGHLAALPGLSVECQRQPDTFYRPTSKENLLVSLLILFDFLTQS